VLPIALRDLDIPPIKTHPASHLKSASSEDRHMGVRENISEDNVGPDTPLLRRQPNISAEDRPSLRSLLANPRVRTAIINYSILSLIDIAFVVLQPLILATPVSAGGLGMSPPQIGTIMGVFGLLDGVIEIICFPPLCRAIGTKRVYMLGIGSFWVAIAAFPLMNVLVRWNGLGIHVYLVMFLQLIVLILDGMAFGRSALISFTSLSADRHFTKLVRLCS
jgi:hypothetical protein